MRQRGVPLRIGQIERRGFERLVRRGARILLGIMLAVEELAAGLVVIRDQLQTRDFGFLHLMREEDQRARRVAEQRFEMVVEKRQPVLHALMLAPGADALIEHIVARRGAEGADVTGAETADGFRVQWSLRGGEKLDLGDLIGGELRLGIEFADRIERRAEEVEPQRFVHTRRPQVDNAAAQREIARLAHSRGLRVSVAHEERDQRLMLHRVADLRGEARLRDGRTRRHALERRVHRGDDDGGTVLAACEGGERGEPFALDIRLGRNTVVGRQSHAGNGSTGKSGAKKASASCNACACASSAATKSSRPFRRRAARRRHRRHNRRACR